MKDGLGRTIEYLRISVTDRCNLRCRYCMPQEGIQQLEHRECLTLEEIYRLVAILADMGIRKVRFTGGEPMVRKNLVKLVRDVAGLDGIQEVAMTTNGVLFADRLQDFADAGLDSVNISLDTLDPEGFRDITGTDALGKVLEAIRGSVQQGLKVKVNCVPSRELNARNYLQVATLARDYPVDVRFIELMPIGCGKEFTSVTGEETLKALEERFGFAVPEGTLQHCGPARYVRFPDFKGRIGFIDPMSHKFCPECNRIRLTVEGKLKLCLYYADNTDLKKLLREGASDERIRTAIEEALKGKPREHFFGENKDQDARKMVQIGG